MTISACPINSPLRLDKPDACISPDGYLYTPLWHRSAPASVTFTRLAAPEAFKVQVAGSPSSAFAMRRAGFGDRPAGFQKAPGDFSRADRAARIDPQLHRAGDQNVAGRERSRQVGARRRSWAVAEAQSLPVAPSSPPASLSTVNSSAIAKAARRTLCRFWSPAQSVAAFRSSEETVGVAVHSRAEVSAARRRRRDAALADHLRDQRDIVSVDRSFALPPGVDLRGFTR